MDNPSDSGTALPQPRATLEVWCELQCPDCHRAQTDLRALRERYGDALEIRLRHFPLEKHKHAYAAAQAFEEAYGQGKGEEYAAAVLARAPGSWPSAARRCWSRWPATWPWTRRSSRRP